MALGAALHVVALARLLGPLPLPVRRRWSMLAGALPLPVAAYLWLCEDGNVGMFSLWREEASSHVVRVFFPLLFADLTAVCLGIVGVLTTAIVLLASGRGRAALLGRAALALVTALALGGAFAHFSSLRRHSTLPLATVRGPAFVHVGRPRDARFMLAYSDGSELVEDRREAWSLVPAEGRFEAASPRSFPVTLRARSGSVSLVSHLEIRVTDDRSDPLLPLRVGNRWDYETETTCRFQSGRTTHGSERLSLRVAPAEERYGLTLYHLQEIRQEHSPWDRFTVFGAAGRTWVLGEHDVPRPAVLALEGARCRIGFADVAGECERGPFVAGGPIALPGPARWTEHTSSNRGNQIAMGILTLGIYAPEPRECETKVRLLASAPGTP